MRFSSLGVAAFALVALMAGCAPTDSNGDAASSERAFRVALITPGPVSDAGWSAMAYDGLMAIQEELGAEVANRVATEAEARDAMRAYAQEGFDLILGHGFEYNAPGVELSEQFPNTVFVSTSGDKTSSNAGALRFHLEQSFYLAGYASALLSESKTLAMIGGPDVPSIRSTFAAYRAGAQAAVPDVRVIEVFTGSNDDIAAAKQATYQAVNAGADIVIHQANAAAQGVFDVAKERSIWAMGANMDQNDNPSGAVIASAIMVAKPAMLDLARRVMASEYVGEQTYNSMETGAIEFIWSPNAPEIVTDEIRQRVDAVRSDILEGRLTVPKLNF